MFSQVIQKNLTFDFLLFYPGYAWQYDTITMHLHTEKWFPTFSTKPWSSDENFIDVFTVWQAQCQDYSLSSANVHCRLSLIILTCSAQVSKYK